MNAILLPMTDGIIDKAFEIEETNQRLPEYRARGLLYSGGIDEVDAATLSAMDRIRELMKETAKKGWEAVKQKFHEVVDYIHEKAKTLGQHAAAFTNQLLEQMKNILNNTYDLLLGTMRTKINIGEREYEMDTVEIIHSLKLSGSLELSLETLCKFAASGEISINGSYKLVIPFQVP